MYPHIMHQELRDREQLDAEILSKILALLSPA